MHKFEIRDLNDSIICRIAQDGQGLPGNVAYEARQLFAAARPFSQ